ncbi:MAG: TraR/DksA C4-type zinc finger protein [Candidatus Cloacimonetes bacterium]|jgi:RNA polymerase-binding protein DksA|nr:TraR/DksA C4-type zinc finger protein [Candidatus Cloacimonadota bacterium]MCB5286705.1 TraR/DksA C4-type zinc finger protein [Candidatus Cloacimonadota bacterium]MCK9184453.1 TraR/DksA C4-type zinc finger protein [Candidatus Cloacimonadota bacterium]MCK9584481.1 TraR/DksA C4-type zinc finger protein [Candidatus Cloacimonadota bacterium]MDY0229026.1 TraR/DksA family transcriptional regulator [Candidatus Cloacimonadaceae bacterium]
MAEKKLSADKLKFFEDLIRAELKESMAYIESINQEQSVGSRESSGDLSSYAYHQADQGSETNYMEHTVMMMESEREKIRKLNDAMRRLRDGQFGFCEMCGEEIPSPRLQIIPYATLCIDCKEKMETKKRKQRR